MAKSTPPDEPLSRKDVRELIQLMRKNRIQEFELEQGDLKLRIVTSRADRAEAKSDPPAVASYPNVVYSAPPGMVYSPGAAAYPPVGLPHPGGAVNGMPAVAPVMVANGVAGALAVEKKAADEEDASLKKITSPMVGTFYRAPAPDAKPYVDVGSRVEEESVLCIVEAMKLMNEIKAEMRGVVRRILVENGQPVEYGQPLFLIDPA